MGKKAMVTGASGGIGEVFATALAKEGWAVTLVARSATKLDELASKLPGASAITADLSDPADIARVAQGVREGGYDLLVNNAGIGVYGRFDETPLDTQLAMMRLNMDALVTLSHAFLATAKSGDALVNVASTLGLLAFPTASAYAATKYFVIGFSESLWHEQKARGVYVMVLAPGATITNFHSAAGGTEKNAPPAGVSQTPEQVVAVARAALAARSSPTVVSGFSNKAMVFMSRFMPRWAVVDMMGSFAPKS